MADFGTFAARSLAPTIIRPGVGTFGGTTFTEFDIGTFAVRSLGTGAGGTTIEVEVVVPAPPSTNGVGDWPMRFFGGTLSADTAGAPNELYMCPADSVLYVRFYQIINRSASARTVKLFFVTDDGSYQQENVSLAAGASITSTPDFMFNLGEGEIIAASASGADVYCNVSGIETVS